MKCKEIQEKEEINLKLQNKKKVQKLKEKGITLIALVVTIIILLILAGVTLNMALSGDGLFSRARNATEKYKKAQEDEAELISDIGKEMYSEYVGAYVEGYEPTGGTCTITKEQSGTEEDQEFSTEEEKTDGKELKWRIWDYDGTTLRIILDKPTTQKLALKGADGYNNGVWAINEICRQCFGQYEGNDDNKKMKEGINVANLKRSDIEKVSNYDYTKYMHTDLIAKEITEEIEGVIKFGEIKSYKTSNKFPKMWGLNDSKWNYENEDGVVIKRGKKYLILENEGEYKGLLSGYESGDESTAFSQTFYEHDYKDRMYEFSNEKYYDLIFCSSVKNGTYEYWFGDRYTFVADEGCTFGLNVKGRNLDMIGGFMVFNTDGDEVESEAYLRPVIEINLEKSFYNLERLVENDRVTYKLSK